jgi:hypothetical protein
MRWSGWLWVGSAWQRVCAADDIGTCARRLGVVGKHRGIGTRYQALTGGAAPTFTPKTRAAMLPPG